MTMNTGDIARRLGFPISTDALVRAGITVAGKDKAATLFADDWETVCTKLAKHILERKSTPQPPKPEPKRRSNKAESSAPAPAASAPAPAPAADTSWEDDDDL
jgi:hypothetical protein